MVSAQAESLPLLQAKAQLLERLHDQLTQPSFADTQAQYKTTTKE